MFNVSIIIVIAVNFLQIGYAPDPTSSSNSSIENNPPDETYAKIQSSEVLPLVLFPGHVILTKTPILDLAENLVNPVLMNGRLVEGTKFSTRSSEEQMFFCPKEDSDEICLEHRQFEKSEPLQCVKEAIPIAIAKESLRKKRCTSGHIGITFNIGYEICSTEELLKYHNRQLELYNLCYDQTNGKTLHTVHHLRSPNLLQSKQLEQERIITYPFRINNEFNLINLREVNIESVSGSNNLPTHSTKPLYKLQKLVPDEDMAFALWRKTTYENFNYDWQHETLIPLWNKINNYIRSNAIRLFDQNFDTYIHTGVFNAVSPSKNDGQMYNIWIKTITAIPFDFDRISIDGVAILMNNFLDDTLPNAREALSAFCEEDLCEQSLKNESIKIGAGVRCCDLSNGKVRALFGATVVTKYPVLKIPGINWEEISA